VKHFTEIYLMLCIYDMAVVLLL